MSQCADFEPFALRVIGDSMSPEFADGQIVVVEPAVELVDGTFVVAQHDGGFLLRRLTRTEGAWQLEALNPAYAPIELDDKEAIRGRVIQRAGRRRRDRKHYV